MKLSLCSLLVAACLCSCVGTLFEQSYSGPLYRLENCSTKENREIAEKIARLQKEAHYLIITQNGVKSPIAVLERTAEWDVIFERWAGVKEWQENKRCQFEGIAPAPPTIAISLSFVGADQSAPAILTLYKTPYRNEDFSPIAKGGRSMYDDLLHELTAFPLCQGEFFPGSFERASQGKAEQQVYLASYCLDGEFVLRPNPKEGYTWLNKAIAQKCVDAYELYALIYAEGRYGQKKDKQKAIAYYEQAFEALAPEENFDKMILDKKIQKLQDSLDSNSGN